VRYKVLR